MNTISDIFVLIGAISAAAVIFFYLQDRSSISIRGIWRLPCLFLGPLGVICYLAYRFFDGLPSWPAHVAFGCFWAVIAANCYQNFRNEKGVQ